MESRGRIGKKDLENLARVLRTRFEKKKHCPGSGKTERNTVAAAIIISSRVTRGKKKKTAGKNYNVIIE